MTTARPIEIGEIARLLAAEIRPLCHKILPNGVRQGEEWRVGSVAGEKGTSMGVRLSGPKAGVWIDSAHDADRGDALDLVAAVEFGGDKRAAIRWARGWLGLDGIDPDAMAKKRRVAEDQAAKDARHAAAADQAKRERAIRIFTGAQKQIAGTPAERYLSGRAIDFARLGRQPGALRFAPELADPIDGLFWPALVAAIAGPSGRMIAVHRTYLEVQPDGRVVKAPISDPSAKFSLGKYAGGCIRLWRGASGKPLGEALPGEWAVIGEGIEDTSSSVMAAPELRHLVAVSGGGFQSLKLPPAIAGVILLGQREDNAGAQANWDRVIGHYHDLGKRVRLALPPPGIKDINAYAQALGEARRVG